MPHKLVALFTFLFSISSVAAMAQDREVPYWATIRASATELNMRVGPSSDYPIVWIYKRPGLPMKVVRTYESWRLVRDLEGAEGWVASRLLSPERGAIVVGKFPAEMRDERSDMSKLRWRAAPGVVGRLGNCEEGWCEFAVGKRKGWVRQNHLWGAGDP